MTVLVVGCVRDDEGVNWAGKEDDDSIGLEQLAVGQVRQNTGG